MGGGAAYNGRPQVTREDRVGRVGARDNLGRGEMIRNGRTAWQRIVGCLTSQGTGISPHNTLGLGTMFERGCKFMAPRESRE